MPKSKSDPSWVVSQGWTVSFPPSSIRFTLDSWIGLAGTSLASYKWERKLSFDHNQAIKKKYVSMSFSSWEKFIGAGLFL
jgi:hypothetical protein